MGFKCLSVSGFRVSSDTSSYTSFRSTVRTFGSPRKELQQRPLMAGRGIKQAEAVPEEPKAESCVGFLLQEAAGRKLNPKP